MLKSVKILLSIVVSLFLISGLGLAALVILVKPDAYRPQITQYLSNKTGRIVTIANIDWAILPKAHFKIYQLTINNPEGFDPSPFVQVGKTDLEINLWQLLSKKLIVKNVTFENAKINFIKNLNGSNNWNFSSEKSAKLSSPSASSNNGVTTKPVLLSFKDIRIVDSTINWQDAAHNQQYNVYVKNLDITNMNLEGAPFKASTNLTYNAKNQNIAINARAEITLKGQQYQFNPLTLSINGGPAIIAQTHINLSPQLAITAQVQAPIMNISTAWLPLLGWNNMPIQKIGGKLTLTATKNSLVLNPLAITIDDTQAKGQINLTSLQPLQGSATLSLDQINLDNYLIAKPTAPTTSTATDTTVSSLAAPASALPKTLQTASLNAAVTIGTLTFHHLLLTQVNLPVILESSILRIAPINAQAAQGTLQAQVTANYTAPTPLYSTEGAFDNINVKTLLSQWSNYQQINGNGHIEWSLTSACNNSVNCIANLNGMAKIAIKDGTYTGFDVMKALENAATLFLKQPLPNSSQPDQTNFSELNATYNIQNGIANNPDLTLLSSVLKLTGDGKINFVTQEIDYHLAVTPLTNVSLQVAQLQKLIGATIPLKLYGTFNKPILMPDMNQISQDATKENLNKNLQDIGDTVDKASKNIAKSLKDIFN